MYLLVRDVRVLDNVENCDGYEYEIETLKVVD